MNKLWTVFLCLSAFLESETYASVVAPIGFEHTFKKKNFLWLMLLYFWLIIITVIDFSSKYLRLYEILYKTLFCMSVFVRSCC